MLSHPILVNHLWAWESKRERERERENNANETRQVNVNCVYQLHACSVSLTHVHLIPIVIFNGIHKRLQIILGYLNMTEYGLLDVLCGDNNNNNNINKQEQWHHHSCPPGPLQGNHIIQKATKWFLVPQSTWRKHSLAWSLSTGCQGQTATIGMIASIS